MTLGGATGVKTAIGIRLLCLGGISQAEGTEASAARSEEVKSFLLSPIRIHRRDAEDAERKKDTPCALCASAVSRYVKSMKLRATRA